MFAEVYPLVRLPRRFTFFDYRIPESLDVNVGDVVEASFRRQKILGVVRKVKAETDVRRTVPIKSVLIPGLMNEADIIRIEKIAEAIVQSPATVLYSALSSLKGRNQSPPKRKSTGSNISVQKKIVEDLQTALSNIENHTVIQTSNEGAFALASMLRRKFENQILIIAPREKLVKELLNSVNFDDTVQILHGHTPAAEREAIIRAWASGNIKTLIGSRQVSILPAKKLDAVLILESSSDDYSHLSRNPRIDPRLSAELLAKDHGAKLLETCDAPRLEPIFNKANINFRSPPTPDVISLKAKEQSTGTPFLTEHLFKAIYTSLQNRKSVLLSFNRKGVANRLQCANCDHIPMCGSCGSQPIVRKDDLVCKNCGVEMWIPKVCPGCKSDRLKQKGLGNKRLQEELQKEFPEAKVGIVDNSIQETDADIIIATEYFFKNNWNTFNIKKFDVVAELSFDNALVGTDFRTAEYAVTKLYRLIHIAEQQNAKCIIQTWMPELVREMLKTEKFLKSELDMRIRYGLPPHTGLITIMDKPNQSCSSIPITDNILEELKTLPDDQIITTDINSYESPNGSQKS